MAFGQAVSTSAALDYQLYLQKSWIEDPERCNGVGVPEGTVFQTKQQLVKSAKMHWRIERDYQEMKQGSD